MSTIQTGRNELLQKNSMKTFWWLMALALLVLGAGIGLRDPWPADEPRFALVAKEMIDSGQWFFPMRGGEIYPDKPPMFMWAIALFYWLTGSIRLSFLLPSMLAGMGTLALTWDMARRLWNEHIAFIAGLVLLFTIQFTLQSKTAQIDGLVTFFITFGLYSFVRFLFPAPNNKAQNSSPQFEANWRWYYLGWFSAGLGVITKGVGILALFILIPALWTHREYIRQASKKSVAKAVFGFVVMLIAIGLWLLPMVWMVEQSGDLAFHAYRDNILLRQTVTRYAESWHHIKPFWYYLVQVMPVFWLPFSLFLPWLVVRWYKAIKVRDNRVILLLSYMVLIFLFFSISPGKRGVYITPATPAFALLVAPWITELLQRIWPTRLLKGLGWLLVIIGIAGSITLLVNAKLAAKVAEYGNGLWLSLLVLGVGVSIINWVLRYSPFKAICTTFAFVWILYSTLVCWQINDGRTPEGIMTKIADRVPADQELLFVDFKEQHLLFSQQSLWHYPFVMDPEEQGHESAAWIQEKAGRWVVGAEKALAVCFDVQQGESMGIRHRTNWVLVSAAALKPECIGTKTTIKPYYYQLGSALNTP